MADTETEEATATEALTPQSDADVARLVRLGHPPVVDAPLPDWARASRQAFDQFHNWRRLRWHQSWSLVKQIPRFLLLLVAYSPRGIWRLAAMGWRFLWDQDTAELRAHYATNLDSAEYERVRRGRAANLRARWIVVSIIGVVVSALPLAYLAPHVLSALAGLVLVGLVIAAIPGKSLVEYAAAVAAGALVFWFLPRLLPLVLPPLPTWALAVGMAMAVLALGWVGRPEDQRLVQSATPMSPERHRLTADYTIAALVSLGIQGLSDKTQDQIRLLSDVARVGGRGSQVELELPPGVTANAVQAKRSALSAALRRELGCVWPSVGPRHEGHLSLFVGDQPMVRAQQPPWPLAKTGTVDLFAPVPVATDQRGDWVSITLAYANAVIGATPRMGKTYFLRELLLIAGLDPRARVYAIDNKGTGDLAPCGLFTHFYSVGEEPEDVEAQLGAMRQVREELRRRARIIRQLPREECPESKVTSALANRRDLCPIVIGVDEVQVWLEDAPKEIREEFTAICTDLVKRGPALGIIVLLATQNVNAKTVPTGISNNAVIRFCLKMFGWQAGDQVLGTGAYKAGLDAQMFDFSDKGVGYLRADGAEAQIVRTVFGLDAVESEKVAARARAIRQMKGLLSGMAAGEDAEYEALQVSLIEDIRQVMDTAALDRAHLGDLRARLALLRSETYKHLTVDALGAQLRAAGVVPKTVWSPSAKSDGKGIKRGWLEISTTEKFGAFEESADD